MAKIDELYRDLEAIGFRVSHSFELSNLNNEPDIEKTLVRSLYYIDDEGRLLGLLFTWLKVHGLHIIADKFFKEYEEAKVYLGETPWFAGVCAYMYSLKDHRFKKGIKRAYVEHSFGNRDQTSLIKLKGPVGYLEAIGIQVPASAIRIREHDVLSVEELLKFNKQYRNRYIFGANWRSEIITSIQNGAKNPNQVAKMLGIARSRVGIVFNEYIQVKKYI